MKWCIGLATAVVICAIAQSGQAGILFSASYNAETANPWNAFGIEQNQSGGSNAAQVWQVFVDNLSYSTASGTETQTFDSQASASAAGWTGNAASTTSPNNFGYSATSNAGGAAGEAGGIISRGSASAGYYADTTIGAVDMLSDLHASGRLSLNGTAANNSFFLGWIDVNNLGRRFGFQITENNGTVPDMSGARVTLTNTGANGTATGPQGQFGGVIGVPLYFSLDYIASTKTLTGVISTVPEPTSISLLAISFLGLLGTARNARI